MSGKAITEDKRVVEPLDTIPIMLDHIRELYDFSIARCTYFSVSCDMPAPNWQLIVGNVSLPIYLLGLSGIIVKPIGKIPTFLSAASIEELFDTVESNPQLFVDINDIWLPKFLLNRRTKQRGSVYRISKDLFGVALLFREGKIGRNDYIQRCREMKEALKYSENETKAFSGWTNSLVKEAKALYPKNSKYALKWREDIKPTKL